jgi:hypothetical protein
MKASSPSGNNRRRRLENGGRRGGADGSSGESLPRGGFGSLCRNGAESSNRSGTGCSSPIKRPRSGGGRSHDVKWAQVPVVPLVRATWEVGGGADRRARAVSRRGEKGTRQRLPARFGPTQQERREEGKGKARRPRGKWANGPNRKEVKESE